MNRKIVVSLTPDENGFIGRECPKCNMYFKVKPGTGLPINHQICPYCSYQGLGKEFYTKDQIEYAKELALQEIMDPLLKTLNGLEKRTKGEFIEIKVRTSGIPIQITKYQEKILETDVTCDNCGLIFSIYGVFSNCPDCGKLNYVSIFNCSLESSKKMIKLSNEIETDLKEELLKGALTGAISSFDSIGKELKRRYPERIQTKKKNFFQNYLELQKVLQNTFNKDVNNFLNHDDSEFIFKMFQVRHIYEHNSGIIDDDFIKAIPTYSNAQGRKYQLTDEEIDVFIIKLQQLANMIFTELKEVK